MQHKITSKESVPQRLIAGMDRTNPNDVEFVAIQKNMTVMLFQAGKAKPFRKLKPLYFALINNQFMDDRPAQDYFRTLETEQGVRFSTLRKIELYTYFLWGSLDHKPDIKDDVLQPSENFRHVLNCPSIRFTYKHFTLNNVRLCQRDLIIIDMSAEGLVDEAIAQELGIAVATLNCHKKNLFTRTGAECKLDLVSQSYREKLIS